MVNLWPNRSTRRSLASLGAQSLAACAITKETGVAKGTVHHLLAPFGLEPIVSVASQSRPTPPLSSSCATWCRRTPIVVSSSQVSAAMQFARLKRVNADIEALVGNMMELLTSNTLVAIMSQPNKALGFLIRQ